MNLLLFCQTALCEESVLHPGKPHVFPFLTRNAQNSPQFLTKVSSWMTPKGKMGEQETTQYVGC